MNAAIKHLTPRDYRVMPWKNGAGSTTEIAVSDPMPDGGFAWRVSVADLKASGPFSAFAGVDRVIVPIEGPAFRLDHAALGSQLVSPLTPYFFAGEWETAATLAGPGKDYNVMTRRGRWTSWVEAHRVERATSWRRTYPKGIVFVTALAGSARVANGAGLLALNPWETAQLHDPGTLAIATDGAAALIWAILSYIG